jgi:hypothetical protein
VDGDSVTRSYGDMAAEKIMDDYAGLVMAALDGDLNTLRALLSATAQFSYTAGYGAAASVMGVTS